MTGMRLQCGDCDTILHDCLQETEDLGSVKVTVAASEIEDVLSAIMLFKHLAGISRAIEAGIKAGVTAQANEGHLEIHMV